MAVTTLLSLSVVLSEPRGASCPCGSPQSPSAHLSSPPPHRVPQLQFSLPAEWSQLLPLLLAATLGYLAYKKFCIKDHHTKAVVSLQVQKDIPSCTCLQSGGSRGYGHIPKLLESESSPFRHRVHLNMMRRQGQCGASDH